MATTEQIHQVIVPWVRIEQTRRRPARRRVEGLVDRITLPQAGRTRMWLPTVYGVQLASERPEMRGHRPSGTVSDPTAVRLKAGHTLTVTESALVFLEGRTPPRRCVRASGLDLRGPPSDRERRGCIPDALLYYRRGPADGDKRSMLRAFVEVDRATMGAPNASPPSRPRTSASTASYPWSQGGCRPSRNRRLGSGGGATRPSCTSCSPRSSWTASDRPASRTGSAPCAQGPGCRPAFRHDVPVLVTPPADCSSKAPPHPCGIPRSSRPPGQRVSPLDDMVSNVGAGRRPAAWSTFFGMTCRIPRPRR
ncbi:replication-relaxation family protein [Streptomyces sp. NBC_00280]|uniref:replication-relaxation family protein n=1 Tax=Streptomyces sp. NBC_00280 TaxID=2975699 RepID=UPI00352F912D